MRPFKTLKARILKRILTWSTMGKQTTEAKEVYFQGALISEDAFYTTV